MMNKESRIQQNQIQTGWTRPWHTALLVVSIAAAYLLAAWLGRLIAPDSPFPAPFAPAAGVALAALIGCGLRYWPAVFLGDLVFRLVSGSLFGDDLWPAALGSAGVAAQAALGAVLTRRCFTNDVSLEQPGVVLHFLLLAGPVSSMVSASVTVAATAAFSPGLAEFAASNLWVRTWAADAVGVALVAPIALLAWPRMVRTWGAHRALLLVPLVVGAVVLVVANMLVQQLLDAKKQQQRQEIAENESQSVQAALIRVSERLHAVELFFINSDEVTATEFAGFAAPLLSSSGIESIAWAPRIPRHARAEFEAYARRATGQADYRVSTPGESVSAGSPAPADDHFPQLLVVSEAGLPATPGFDYGGQDKALQAIEAALHTTDGQAVRAFTQRDDKKKLIFYHLAYRADFDAHQADVDARRAALRGVVIGAVDAASLIGAAVSAELMQQGGLRIQLLPPGGTALMLIDRIPEGYSPDWRLEIRDPAFPLLYEGASRLAPLKPVSSYPLAALLFALFVSAFSLVLAGDAGKKQRARKRLAESEQRYRQLFENLNAGFVVFEVMLNEQGTPEDLVIETANQEFAATAGMALVDMIGRRVTDVLPGIESDTTDWIGLFTTVALTGQGKQFEGQSKIFGTHFAGFAYPPEPNRCAVTLWNIGARKRTELLRSRLNEVLESIAGDRPLPQILEELVRSVEEYSHGVRATVLLRDEAGKQLRHGAAPSFPTELSAAIDGIPIGPTGGACGSAAYQGKRVIIEDIQTDTLMLGYRELAARYDLRAVWSEPIPGRQGCPLGTFAMYHDRPRIPTDDEIRLIELAARIAGLAIERKRADDSLRVLNAELEARVEDRTRELATANATALRKEREIRSLVDNLTDCVIHIDTQGIVRSVNPAVERILGFAPAEVIGRNLSMLMPEPHRTAHDYYLARYLGGGEARIIGIGREVQGQHKDGRLIPLELAVSEYQVEGQQLFTGILRDITQRKLSDAALQRFKLILDDTDDMVFMFDASTLRFTYLNQGAVDSLGYDEAELLQMHPYDIKPDFPESPFRQVVAPLLTGEIPLLRFQTVHRRKDGTDFPVDILLQRMGGDDLSGDFVAIVRDVTNNQRIMRELQQAREDADSANRAKSAFLATMSHEIRTPMNGVLGMLEVLEHSHLTEHQRDQVQTIRSSGATLLALIDDILDFSKIEAGRIELEQVPLSVADLVEGLCTSQLSVARQRGVALRMFVDPDLPERVLGDDTRLRQVLYNLVGNAIKFSAGNPARSGRVAVRATLASREPVRIAFTVEDNGIGMDEAAQARLFTPFTQAQASTTRRFGGTGLGLTICRRLVEVMGGEISVSSRPGEGSVFTVTLPFDLAPEQSVREQPDLSGLSCFLLDDAAIDAEAQTRYLENAGATVQRCTNIEKAIRFAAAAESPVVLVHADNQNRLWRDVELPAQLRRVRIDHGRRRRARLDAPDCVSLDGDALRRQTFLSAVAVAAGRASPEIFDDRSTEALPDESTPAPTVAQARSENRLILVAEDDSVNQKVALQQLALLGYAAEVAGDGAEALAFWEGGGFALLLTDLHMPVMDGYQLAAAIRRREHGSERRMPIIALTANALRDEATRAKAAGMDDYLTKPVALARLREVLDAWLPQEKTMPEIAPPRANAAAPARALDVAVLQRLVGDDTAILHDFLSEYARSAAQAAAELRATAGVKDHAQLAAIAHQLKSSSRAVGALPLGDLCAELENAGKRNDAPAVERGMAQFETLYAEVEEELAPLLPKEEMKK